MQRSGLAFLGTYRIGAGSTDKAESRRSKISGRKDLSIRNTGQHLYCWMHFNKISVVMKEKNYIPQPIDTTDVKLPEDLESLVEQMSKNVHEIWAETRISQGWTFGEKRNDDLKTHPCLVPYEELPEEEKAYDRNTSIGTLKLIMKLGFRICK